MSKKSKKIKVPNFTTLKRKDVPKVKWYNLLNISNIFNMPSGIQDLNPYIRFDGKSGYSYVLLERLEHKRDIAIYRVQTSIFDANSISSNEGTNFNIVLNTLKPILKFKRRDTVRAFMFLSELVSPNFDEGLFFPDSVKPEITKVYTPGNSDNVERLKKPKIDKKSKKVSGGTNTIIQ